MGDPRITVLMPVKHYHAGFLRQAFESVFNQSSPRWRLLVIDDGAEGDAFREITAAALEDDRVSVVPSEGRGLSGALNTGICHATTDFSAILLGDDLWSREAVEVLTSHIERFPEIDFFHSARVIIDEDNRELLFRPVSERVALEDFVRGSPARHLLCWRRELALRIGGLDETLNSVGPDDYDFPWSMAEAGARFMGIPDCLYLHRDHRESFRLTTHLTKSTHRRELWRILRKHGVGRWTAARRVARASRHYLRQCIYRNRFDRWLKTKLDYDPRRGWRETR